MSDEKDSCEANQHESPTKKYDIGILGFWYGHNYGSMLTSFAMYRVVEKLGYSAIHINKPTRLWSSYFTEKDSISVKFANQYSKTSTLQSQFHMLNEHCHAFLVGSDTVWDPLMVGHLQPLFFLNFANLEKKKIAYASSFGRDHFTMHDSLLHQYCKYACSRIDSVSVREESGVHLMHKEFDRKATRVLDPVFLLEADEYLSMAEEKRNITTPKEFIFSNILAATETKISTYQKIYENRKLPTVNFANVDLTEEDRLLHPLDIVSDYSVENWLYCLHNADLAVSDSFHVTCFSIIFKTNFITIIDPGHELVGRFTTLLHLVGLEDRLVFTNDTSAIPSLIETPINFGRVHEKLEHERTKSLSWLKNALSTPAVRRDQQQVVIDDIITHLFRQTEIVDDQLYDAQLKLIPLNDLNSVKNNYQQKSAKDHLRSCSFIRWAFRAEYWRCRFMLLVSTKKRKRLYLARIEALVLGLRILVH